MEDVLDLYEQAPNPEQVRLCFDERPCRLLGETIEALPMKAGKVKRENNEYTRNGTAVVLLAYDIDKGKRYVQVRERRTEQQTLPASGSKDYAQFMDWLVSEHYAHTQHIHLVQDNLNTHTLGAFYEHLPAGQAREIAQKVHFHFTPKHGSWLNMAEIEFSALASQCLNRRIDNLDTLQKEVMAWADERNRQAVKIHWSFTVDTARDKLNSQYEKVNQANCKSKN